MEKKKIIAATGNSGKMKEIRELLTGLPIELSSLKDHWQPLPEIPETGATFLENARIKADWVFERTGLWALADDSGLEVDALDGAPGVRSARYAGETCDNAANNRKLLRELEACEEKFRTARFRCVIVLKTAPDDYLTTEGICEGRIGFTPEGDRGFGYDPLFIPQGFNRTFAQLDSSEKHEISHRGKALKKLTEILNECFKSKACREI